MNIIIAIFSLVIFVQASQDTGSISIGPKIVGGNEVTPHSIPYQVLLDIKDNDKSFTCGASLISPEWVLTAAHCFPKGEKTTVYARLGAHKLLETAPGEVKLLVAQVIIHKDWYKPTFLNDIALLKLPQAVELTDNIKIINLPKASDANNTLNGETVRLSGWGKESTNAPGISAVLRSVDLKIIRNDVCDLLYLFFFIKNSNVCTSSRGGKDACHSDSGGPLTWGKGETLEQVGIVSFGLGCGVWPGVFTRVTSYLDWISANTGIAIRP